VTHASQVRSRSTGRLTAVIILVIIAILAIIAGILYLTEPAKSLPSVLGTITQPALRADEHRTLRGWISLVIAVILLGAAWFTARARGQENGLPAQGRRRERSRAGEYRWLSRKPVAVSTSPMMITAVLRTPAART
jgi:hypothetical protein